MHNTVTARLHTMRKPQTFHVQPMTDGRICVQSDKSIGMFDPADGKGRLSVKGNTFVHVVAHGFSYEFPADFRTQCQDVLTTQEPVTELGGIRMINKITVIE